MTGRPEATGGFEGFELNYKFIAGSMPPPDHDEYEIVLSPEGKGRLAFWPDYRSFDPPCWQYEFTADPQRLVELIEQVRALDLFNREWELESERTVGGSLKYLTVTAGDKTVDIPPRLKDRSLVAPLYQAVRDLVPQNIWEDVESKQKEFIANYEEKQ